MWTPLCNNRDARQNHVREQTRWGEEWQRQVGRAQTHPSPNLPGNQLWPALTSSYSGCRRRRLCRNTGLSHTAGLLPKIATTKEMQDTKYVVTWPPEYVRRQRSTFMFSRMAPQSLLRTLLGCLRAWLAPLRMSPIRMDIWATPARHTSSCSCANKAKAFTTMYFSQPSSFTLRHHFKTYSHLSF